MLTTTGALRSVRLRYKIGLLEGRPPILTTRDTHPPTRNSIQHDTTRLPLLILVVLVVVAPLPSRAGVADGPTRAPPHRPLSPGACRHTHTHVYVYICVYMYESRPRRLIYPYIANTQTQGLHTHLILPHAPSPSSAISAKHYAALSTSTTKMVTVAWLLAMLRAGRVLYVLGFCFALLVLAQGVDRWHLRSMGSK